MIYASGVRYIGEFRNSRREGWGSCIFQDGSKYEGNWINDFPEGAGIKTFPSGKEQKGYWKRGNLEREDQTLVLDQNRRIGILKSDCISGNCTNGNGIFLFPNGDIYVGDFVNGKRHGIGVCYYENRSEYRGRWMNDLPNGNGTLTLADGSSRMGYWKQGQIQDHQESQGLATSTASVPPARTATISNCLAGNCINGIGTYQFQDSSRYTGSFVNGLPDGRGTIFYPNGERYEGMLKAGQLHGEGTLIDREGNRIVGLWERGTYRQSLTQPASAVVVDAETPQVGKVWAVVVGIASYAHLQALRFTDDDAYRIFGFLKSPEGGAVPDEQMRVLIDESATRSNILRAMQEIFYKAGPDDLVLMYFSGHGQPGTFLPIDYTGMDNEISHEEINEILRRSPAKFKLFIADACHSGGMLAARSGSSAQPLLKSYYANLAKAQPGTALIMSSKSEETSVEASGLRQGVFSYFLIRGLKGEADIDKDQVVTIQELFDYVYQQVRQYTQNKQSPVIQGDYDRKMPVSVY